MAPRVRIVPNRVRSRVELGQGARSARSFPLATRCVDLRLLRTGISSRLQQLVCVAVLAGPLGCSIYDEGLGDPRDSILNDGAGGASGRGGSSAGKGGAASADGNGAGEIEAGPAADAGTDGMGAGGSAGTSNADANGAGAPNDAPGSSDVGKPSDATIATDALPGDADGASYIDASQDGAVGNDVGVDGTNVDTNTADADDAPIDTPTGEPVVGVLYNIVAEHSGRCMTAIGNVPLNGTNIAQWGCDGSTSQQFRLQGVTTSSYIFVHPATNRCVDVDSSGTADGTNVQIWTCNNSAAQIYALSPAPSPGSFAITNPNSGKCLDVNGAGMADLANIAISTCSGATNQSWRFVEVADR